MSKKLSKLSDRISDLPIGDMYILLEQIYDKLIDKHHLQWGDMLYWLYGHLSIHRPDAQEEYLNGTHPVFTYQPINSLQSTIYMVEYTNTSDVNLKIRSYIVIATPDMVYGSSWGGSQARVELIGTIEQYKAKLKRYRYNVRITEIGII